MNEQVILVDRNDNQIGIMPKLEAHQKGILHRAFSIFIFNSKGELLMQQRAQDKYHSAGLWSNTCCSHPAPDESNEAAATRRLMEEMGMECYMEPVFNFIYKADFDNGLTEHEFDHVYFGFSDQLPLINKSEVNDWEYVKISDLLIDINENPEKYSVWFKDCIGKVVQHRSVFHITT
jgi:isopentenyl-diphosphate delta-isomerase